MKETVSAVEQMIGAWGAAFTLAAAGFGGPPVTVEYSGRTTPDVDRGASFWEQELSLTTGSSIWIATPEVSWREIGQRSLQALGMESPEDSELRDTWRELLVQSLAGLAAWLTAQCKSEVVCRRGEATICVPDGTQWLVVTLRLSDEQSVEVFLAVSEELLHAAFPAFQGSADGGNQAPTTAGTAGTEASPIPAISIPDLDMPVCLSFGRVLLTLEEVLGLTAGCIVPLNRAIDAPGALKLGRRTLLRGPIVESSGFYGITVELFGGSDPVEKGRFIPARANQER